jgi:carboxypeptidase family protein
MFFFLIITPKEAFSMRTLALRMWVGSVFALLLPLAASAQTSGIAGEVKDTSGAVLPGVTVEVASPALIERVRTATTDGSGRFSITNLRTGVYRVTFTLPGFNTVLRENVELTSDFTSTINAEMKVGAIEETITVAAESPLVDVQSITARTVMTRDVMDTIPTGRNIQAVGILIPGTSLALGGGGALSRDVGGSGNLQQSPLQYRGSGDTVQTIEGMRLNNLCAQGAYSGVYWNDNSFQEYSYVTGADSAEMGQGGMRVNMVPKDGGNSFRGQIFGNYTTREWASDNCEAPGLGLPCSRSNLIGDTTFNTNNRLTNVSNIQKIWDFNPSIGGPIKKDKLWFNFTFRHWGVNKTVADSYFDSNPSPFVYTADLTRPGIDDGHIVSRAGRLAYQVSQKDKITWYHDDQNKYRNHWGISSTVPPDASAIQVTPTSFVDVTRWTRTHTSRLLFDAGIAVYDQEYTELYQPEVSGITDKVWDLNAIRTAKVYNVVDNSNNRNAFAWNNPADHFSLLRTYSGSVSYVTGSHSVKVGAALSEGNWRLVQVYTGDVQPITYSSGAPVSVTLRLPTDRHNGIKADTGIYAQDKWTIGRMTLNLGLRYDQFIGESREEDLLPGRFNVARHFDKCADGKNSSKDACVGTVQNWKDVSPRIGVAYDLFGDGRTALKVSVARYVAGEQIATANANNPITALGLTDIRPWTDIDRNGSPFDGNGNIQLNELGTSTSTPTFGKNVPTQSYDPDVLDGWFKRGFNWEYTAAAQHQLAGRVSLSGGYFRRTFGNQVFTNDLRYDQSSFDGPFCVNAPSDALLPGGGGYQVCGLYDLKPSVFALGLPANNLITFSDNFGGETNMYQGFDANLEARFSRGAYVRIGVGAGSRTFDNCNLLTAGYDAQSLAATATGVVGLVPSEAYSDGTSYCHREYPFRPDMKLVGSYTLPFDIQFSGVYQFSRGVQTGGAGPGVLAQWALATTSFAPGGVSNGVPVGSTLGRTLNPGSATKTVHLIREGLDYGRFNLNQLDLQVSKRIRIGAARLRASFDLYNALNSSWPYTVSNAFATSATTSNWLRPTNVLQQRFFKIGASLDF